MSREDAQMKIRLPAELKEQLEKAAVENKRSMNAEVLQRLSESFEKTQWNRESSGCGFITLDSFAIDPEFVEQVNYLAKKIEAIDQRTQ
ncbi:Arc family DNA-binding protein [Xenorhabdus sp. SF857]|nr:Arc family DNA-binding protein [Xenorhabdus sp. SF857]WFQ80477.1 Arc family DNA-binding protein [Xenorhabdus sp. SF857]